MASADTSPLNPTARSSAASPRATGTLAPSRQDQAAQGRLASAIVFILLTAALSALTIWLLNAGFSDDRTLSLWAKIISVRDAAESRLEYLGVVFPHLPAYLLMVLRLVPGLDSPILPYFVSNVMIAWMLTRWSRELAPHTPPLILALATLLILAHPYTLWSATTSVQGAIGLALFYLLCRQLSRLANEDDSPQVYLRIGALLAVMFFADERTTYLVAGLILLLAFITPRELLERGPFAFFLVLLTPFLLAFGSWAYINWLFFDDPLLFLKAPDSAFLGARADLPFTPWLLSFGGDFLRPLLVATGIAVVAFPAFLLLLRRAARAGSHQRVSLVAIGIPLLATALATFHSTLSHPSAMIAFLLASLLIGFELLRPSSMRARWIALAFLALGTIGGWISFAWQPTPAMTEWVSAMRGNATIDRHAPERALGAWLATNRKSTLLDDSAAYAAIVARGDARELVLPYSDRFKLTLRSRNPDVEQIVVANPSTGAGTRDAVSRRFQSLYERGLPGYERVFDSGPWRVYRRVDVR